MKKKDNETKQNKELYCKDTNLRNSEIEPLVLDKYPVNSNDCPDNLNIFNIFDEPIFDEPI